MRHFFKKTEWKILAVMMAAVFFMMAVSGGVTAFAVTAEDDADTDMHAVTLKQTAGGTLLFADADGDRAEFSAGDEVTVCAQPEDGNVLGRVYVAPADGETYADDGATGAESYSFPMPDGDVVITAAFVDAAEAAMGLEYGDWDPMDDYDLYGVSTLAIAMDVWGKELYFEKSDSYVSYGDYNTHEMHVSTGSSTTGSKSSGTSTSVNNAYCIEPFKYAPAEGDKTGLYELTEIMSESKAEKIRKVLWYAYDAPGYDKSLWNTNNGAYSQLTSAHTLMAYIYGGEENAFYGSSHGLSPGAAYISWAEEYLISDTNTYSTYYKILQQPDPPDSFEVYALCEGSYQIVVFWDYEPYGYLTLEKSSANTSITDGNSCYSLGDAVYYVYTDSSCDTRAKDAGGKRAVLTTDSDGKANTLEMETGTYYVKEHSASEGYGLDTAVYKAEVSADNTESVPAVVRSEEPPLTAFVTLTKSSGNTSITDGNSCYDLAGAEYTLYTDSSCKTVAKDADGKDAVLATKSDGTTNTLEMPLGTYYVKETKAATGYMLCSGDYSCEYSTDGVHTVTLTKDNTETNPAKVRCADEPGNDPAGITLYKIDSQTGEAYAQGAADLSGAQFAVKYYDGYYSGDTLPETATRTWVIETVFNEYSGTYVAGLRDEGCFVPGDSLYYAGNTVTLPLGTYTVQEILAPEGYLLEEAPENSKNWVAEYTYEAPVHIGQVTLEDNAVQALSIGNEPDNEHTAQEAVKRYDITLEKHDGETQASMGSVEFRLTSLTTGESHCFWTDTHGNYTSSADVNPHSYDTNGANDMHSGLWFYGTEDGTDGAPVDDGVGALPYDTYLLEELECEANGGMELIEPVTFTVGEGDDYAGEVIDLGLLNNYPAEIPEPYIHTLAWAGDTGTQICYAGGEDGDGYVTLYDSVWYYNLEPEATYGIYGVALDAETREPEYDHFGNEIYAWTTFTADESGSGMEVQGFYFDVEDLTGHRVVFFETVFAVDEDGNVLYETDGDGNILYDEDGRPVYAFYVAEDPDDYANETIYFPQVGTELTDAETGGHTVQAESEVTLVDHVAVTEVPEGETVVISGVLYDKETGELLTDGDGNGITAGGEYVSPGLDTWYADLTFTFDASALAGHAVVAFEDLYLVTGEDTTVLVGRHADPEDENQTVYVGEVPEETEETETPAVTTVRGPKTGDGTPPALWFSAIGASGAWAAALSRKLKIRSERKGGTS